MDLKKCSRGLILDKNLKDNVSDFKQNKNFSHKK